MANRPPWIRGVQSGMPIALGYFPIAVAFGALARQAQLEWTQAALMSAIVFAGASQFLSVSMLISGAGLFQIILATFILNLRHLIMSLAVNDQMRGLSRSWKYFLSFFITDETFALLTLGETSGDPELRRPAYLAGLMLTAYSGWVLGTVLGGVGSGLIPPELTTAMTAGLYALFIGLLVPPARGSARIGVIALISMLLNWLLGQVLDQGWAIVAATAAAAGAGIFIYTEKA